MKAASCFQLQTSSDKPQENKQPKAASLFFNRMKRIDQACYSMDHWEHFPFGLAVGGECKRQ
jgi:hypothetical protein